MTQSEQQKLAWAVLNIPRDTPQRLRVIESLLKLPSPQYDASHHKEQQ